MTMFMPRLAALGLIGLLAAAPAVAQDLTGSAVGDVVEFQGQSFTVVATGEAPTEIVANGDSYVIVIDNTTPVAVIVPEAGTALKLDPEEPMFWIGAEKHPAFDSAYMRANGPGHPFMLLEIRR